MVEGPKVLSLRGWDPRLIHDARLLAGIRAPTCIIHRTDDPFGSIRAARHLADAIPCARLHVLERAGHAPWLEESDRAVAITDEFLRENDNGR